MQVVWFKRDLRVQDNRALSQACARGDVLPLYVVEREYWDLPDASGRHWEFIAESLVELRVNLGLCGQPLIVRTGDVIDVLEDIKAHYAVECLWSHEETGNAWTYQRDRRVAAWCRNEGIAWRELQNHGVQRRLRSRDDIRSTFAPDDGRCMCLFDGESAEQVQRLNDEAGLPYNRVVAALDLTP